MVHICDCVVQYDMFHAADDHCQKPATTVLAVVREHHLCCDAALLHVAA